MMLAEMEDEEEDEMRTMRMRMRMGRMVATLSNKKSSLMQKASIEG